MHLVEDDDRHVVEEEVALEHLEEDALGDEEALGPGVQVLSSDRVSESFFVFLIGFLIILLHFLQNPTRAARRRDPPRLCHQNSAPVAETFRPVSCLQQHLRHLGRLPRPRRCGDCQDVVVRDDVIQVLSELLDRQLFL